MDIVPGITYVFHKYNIKIKQTHKEVSRHLKILPMIFYFAIFITKFLAYLFYGSPGGAWCYSLLFFQGSFLVMFGRSNGMPGIKPSLVETSYQLCCHTAPITKIFKRGQGITQCRDLTCRNKCDLKGCWYFSPTRCAISGAW